MPDLAEIDLAAQSDVRVQYLVPRADRGCGDPVLVVRYIGTYRTGSEGSPDARYMEAMARAGVTALDAWGVVHDLAALKYEWGDELERIFDVGRARSGSPAAVVVGPDCEEAVRTLVLGEASTDPIEQVKWIFRDLDEAVRYVFREGC